MSNRAIYVSRARGSLDLTIHLTSAYRELVHRERECPVAEALFHKYVSLPIHPRLTAEAVDYVAASIRELA